MPEDAVSRVHELRLWPNSPNPFNPRTMIVFDLPDRCEVRLRIYDAAGRCVRDLIGGETMTPGRKEVVWDGVDDRGRRAPAGVYVYRLEADGQTETKRMVLVR